MSELAPADIAIENGVDVDIDVDKDVPEELSAGAAEAGDSATKRRLKKVHRQLSKENKPAAVGFVHGPRSWKNSRRSRNGFGRGLPKKGGAGGKGVWGAPGCELLEAYEDVNDPNFDSENLSNGDIELKVIVPDDSYATIKRKVEPIILEYFENGDTYEAALALDEVVPDEFKDQLVEQIIQIAMDHKSSHREMSSVLISDLVDHILVLSDLEKAFARLLANLSDLMLDIPDAPTVLGNFIARAIGDDCLPPIFIEQMRTKSSHAAFQEALTHAETLYSMRHNFVRLHNVWGVGGALRPVKILEREMSCLLQEYLDSRDIQEASRCLTALEVPHFHHELVYEALIMVLEKNSQEVEQLICALLKTFDSAILVTPDQLERGFFRVYDDLPDIIKDVPLAYVVLDRFIDRCNKEGFITDPIIEKMPNRGRKRFVSEGDVESVKNHRAA